MVFPTLTFFIQNRDGGMPQTFVNILFQLSGSPHVSNIANAESDDKSTASRPDGDYSLPGCTEDDRRQDH
jgi:hypothetical protein